MKKLKIMIHIQEKDAKHMDKIDYKKLNKDLYEPGKEPSIIKIPPMKFIMVDGTGNPNDPDGEYQKAVAILYSLSFTIKMGRKFGTLVPKEDNFVDYAVPPLEGLWWLKQDMDLFHITQKDLFCWTSMIRQPDFITMDIYLKALEEVKKKKPEIEVAKARFITFEEGLCVQCIHTGPFDDEPATVAKLENYMQANGLIDDIDTILPDGCIRRHHELYMKDFRKTKPENLKTIIRHPVRAISDEK
jgi:hypothetical protein